MGNWIQLASGGGYDFDRGVITGPFTVGDDIAWPLAGLNRFVGHTMPWWDVAVHSVAVARTIEAVMKGDEAAKNMAAAGLLHEAHEAIIGDIPTPVAWHLGYEKVQALKREVQDAIYWRLKTPRHLQTEQYHDVVKLADSAALHVEKQMFMVPEPQPWTYSVPEHKWALEMWHQMRRLNQERQGSHSAQLFIQEYRRLVEGKEPLPPRVPSIEAA